MCSMCGRFDLGALHGNNNKGGCGWEKKDMLFPDECCRSSSCCSAMLPGCSCSFFAEVNSKTVGGMCWFWCWFGYAQSDCLSTPPHSTQMSSSFLVSARRNKLGKWLMLVNLQSRCSSQLIVRRSSYGRLVVVVLCCNSTPPHRRPSVRTILHPVKLQSRHLLNSLLWMEFLTSSG